MKRRRLLDSLGAIRGKDQRQILALLAQAQRAPLGLGQGRVDADKILPLVFAEVEDFEGAIRFGGFFELPLHADQALARGVDGEAPEIAADPFAPELFRHRQRGAGAAEEVGDEIAGVGGSGEDAFEEAFGFLSGVARFSAPDLLGTRFVHIDCAGLPGLSSRYCFTYGFPLLENTILPERSP